MVWLMRADVKDGSLIELLEKEGLLCCGSFRHHRGAVEVLNQRAEVEVKKTAEATPHCS
jgi:hypothetical protein